MKTETVYLGHDNSIDLILQADGVAVDLAGVTAMKLTMRDVLISSTNQAADPIRWAQAGYDTGEIRLFLGDEVIEPGTYKTSAWLTVYDPTNPDGVVWGNIPLTVVADVEGEA
jgi:hypothetical protein